MKYLYLLLHLDKCYLTLAIIRIILTCLPQTGYIHPDEFFQSIEVITGKIFDVEINQPWEFNTSFPVRSITPPYLTIGMSLQLLKNLNLFIWSYFHISIITPYFILLFPRIMICCLSFFVDWCLYRICTANSEKYKSRLIVLSTSYVMVIYATRTFSNTIELLLFSLLIYFVSESIIFSTINIRQREYIHKRYNKAKTVVDKARFHKLKLYLENDSLRNIIPIATIVAIGVFNRPTFIAYAVTPVFFWIYRGLGFKSVNSLNFHLRIWAFIIWTIPTIFLCIVIDSFYFGYLTWGEIGVLEISINNFVATPWNFIKYNINSNNLAKHGLHPRYIHAAVNVPLLFNVLGILAYCNFVDIFSFFVKGKYNHLPTVRSIKCLMVTSILVPLFTLSVFPHQEPRFLIPLMLPLVYLYGAKILPESDSILVKIHKTKKPVYKKSQDSYGLFRMWIVINVILTLFYGFIHQGGVFSLISHLSKEIKAKDYTTTTQHHIITSHTYSIPKSLLLERSNSYPAREKVKRLFIYEEGSSDLRSVLQHITDLLDKCKMHFLKCKVYLVLPNSLMDCLHYHLYRGYNDLIVNKVKSFYPHLSIEAFLTLFHGSFEGNNKTFLTHPIESLAKFFDYFGLSYVEVLLDG